MKKNFVSEISSNKRLYVFITIVLLVAFFVRVYRLHELLGFYYDQGRDALVIWDLIHNHKPFLIGPITGLSGIFLGPLFYYLITPFYFLGGGNPVWPAVFLALLATSALVFVYYMGWKMHSRVSGVVAVLVGSFSYYLVLAGRWLSNPTPILLSSMILFWSLWNILQTKNKNWWIVAFLTVGVSLQFESASAFFYLPIIFVFWIWQFSKRKGEDANVPSVKIYFVSALLFLITFVPQIVFNIRHENILLNNFLSLFKSGESFKISFWEVLHIRISYFENVYLTKIYAGNQTIPKFFALASFVGICLSVKNLWRHKVLQLFAFFFIVPAIGYILFQGNHGNIYDYYLTGYYMPMTLFFAIGLGALWRYDTGKIIVSSFVILFLVTNILLLKEYFAKDQTDTHFIGIGYQKQIVNWIFNDAQNNHFEDFNIHVYVPPVIPYSYDYVILWQGWERCGESFCGFKQDYDSHVVYTIYEVDPSHEDRLESWLAQQDNIAIKDDMINLGGITAERRIRKNYEEN